MPLCKKREGGQEGIRIERAGLSSENRPRLPQTHTCELTHQVLLDKPTSHLPDMATLQGGGLLSHRIL